MSQQQHILQHPILAFLKLIRAENLLIVFFTQYLIRYVVLDSLLIYRGQKLSLMLSHFDFFLLAMSTVFIAAAGYIINDYFDVKTDKINRPDTVVIDRQIKRRVAMAAHVIANMLGVALGVYVALIVGNYKLGIIHLIAAGLLWNYSTTFKKQLLVGNIIVALLTAIVPLMVLVYDIPLISEYYITIWPAEGEGLKALFVYGYKYILIFCGFAFLTSLIREIIKDMEDFKGDMETGCYTVPVAWGLQAAKAIVIGLISNTVILLLFIVYHFYESPNDRLPGLYLLLSLVLPLLLLAYKIFRAQSAGDYKKASFMMKLIMLAGLSFSFIIYYLSHYAAN